MNVKLICLFICWKLVTCLVVVWIVSLAFLALWYTSKVHAIIKLLEALLVIGLPSVVSAAPPASLPFLSPHLHASLQLCSLLQCFASF